MKNELTSTFEQVIYQITWVNKNTLIRILRKINNKLKEKDLLLLKNHELKYNIIFIVISDLELMNLVINESIKIKDENLWIF